MKTVEGLSTQVLPLHDDRWLRFVNSIEGTSPGHHPEWASLLAECYGYSVFALALTDNAGNVVAGLPLADVTLRLGGRRWVSLPFTDYVPPLAAAPHLVPLLATELDALRRSQGIRKVEIRASIGDPKVHIVQKGFRHVLALGRDPDPIFRTFHRKRVQAGIRKGEREGAAVRSGERREDLTRIYYSLHAHTRSRLGVPVQSRRFFELLWQRIIEPGHGRLLLAEVGREAIAGIVLVSWQKMVMYKYSASAAGSSPYRPTQLLLWHAIRHACQNGYTEFDFGRTDLDNPGLRSFKLTWGTREETLAYSVLADQPPKYRHDGGPVMRAVIRHSPVAVARIIGELLYKYAA